MTYERSTAIHEAAHAVVARHLGVPLASIDLDRIADRRGLTRLAIGADEIDRFIMDDFDDIQDSEAFATTHGAIAWAGLVAQERAGFPDDGGFGRPLDRSWGATAGSDWQCLLDLADHQVPPDGNYDPLLDHWRSVATKLLGQRWDAVESLASALIEHRHLDANTAASIIDAVPDRAGP